MSDLRYDILINKDNLLDKNYIPSNLYIVDENEDNFHNFLNPALKPRLRKDIKCYVDALINAAKKDGFNIMVGSAYRSFQYQEEVLKNLIKEKGSDAYKLVAMPGASEHQSGLAFDACILNEFNKCRDVLESDDAFLWLKENSYRYGFILRYPKDKESITGFKFEPWHYRFVGLKLAKFLYENDYTLEEYYLLIKKTEA